MTDALTKSYAVALFESLRENNIDLDNALLELQKIAEIIREEKINKFLLHPSIDKNEKIDIIKEALKDFNKTIASFILVLIENNRIDIYEGIIESFKEEYNELKGIINVEIITREPLSREMYKKIVSYVENNYKKRVEATTKTNDDIIGGIIVKVNGTIIDDSILNKLKAIKDTVLNSNKQ
ncbi:MAG: ATP synthase F1 subunit delta [Bacilli bacterium]|nr:ATP synthase F1 subunit delta [Bacilli bacterium]